MLRKNMIAVTLWIFLVFNASSQEVEMADRFRSDGKIYVVVGVILILLIGLFTYMFRIERRVKKLEKK